MKKLTVPLILAVIGAAGAPASAEVCDLEPAPAATLLLPYFEVGPGVDTFFSIHNASPEPALAQVTLWTDWGAPTIWFDVFLTGFDVVRVDLAEVFDGNVPITADLASDPDDSISPHQSEFGLAHPEWDGSFPGCEEFFPFFVNPVVAGTAFDRLANGHRGQPVDSLDGNCLGADHGDAVARGYVTVDSVRRCGLLFAGDDGYFDGDEGNADFRNVLWGDYFILDSADGEVFGDSLVHIEAVDSVDDIPTGYTFYNRFAPDGADRREPLGTVWAASYLQVGNIGNTDLLVWRDPLGADALDDGAPCGGSPHSNAGPDWFPLEEEEVVAFNDAEDAVTLCYGTGIIGGDFVHCFPFATGRYAMSSQDLDPPFRFGWMQMNLNVPPGFPVNPDSGLSQSHVTVVHRIPGFETGHAALRLFSACEDANPSLSIEWEIPFF